MSGLRVCWNASLAGACLVATILAQPAHSAGLNDGCGLLPKQQVAAILGGDIGTATPWPLAGKFACMYEGDAIPGLDLLVNLVVAGPRARQQYEQDILTLYKRSPVAGLGDKAAWSSTRHDGAVADGLDVLSGSYIVKITFLGSPKAVPTEAADLARARALAQRAIANAKRSGM